MVEAVITSSDQIFWSPLPIELWQEIFNLSVTPFPANTTIGSSPAVTRDVFTILHVCRAWRDAAVAYPHLWTQCPLVFPNPCADEGVWADYLSLSVEWLNRARSCLVTLSVRKCSKSPCHARDPAQVHLDRAYMASIRRFWSHVFKSCPSLRVGRLYLGGRSSYGAQVSCGLFEQLPRMSSLQSLVYRGAAPIDYVSPDLWLSSPQLTSVCLHDSGYPATSDLPLSLNLPFHSLTNLQINHTCNLSPLTWRYIFIQCNNLETAQFAIIVNQELPSFLLTYSVCFPKLVRLRLFSPFHLDLAWFTNFEFPVLDRLELHGSDGIIHTTPTSSDPSAVFDQFSSLRHLNVSSFGPAVSQLLRHTKSLTTLTIQSHYLPPVQLTHLVNSLTPDNVQDANQNERAILTPHLERLEFKRLDWALITHGQICTAMMILDKIHDMIKARSDEQVRRCGNSLKEVCIDDSGDKKSLPETFAALVDKLHNLVAETGVKVTVTK